jgi:hypothetical protein
MSEVETFDEVELGVQGEVGAVTGDDVELENNSIGNFLDAIQQQDFTTAGKQFDDMVSDRLQDSLDQAKARIAGQIYNKAEEPVED